MIIVDDGSTDGTAEMLKALRGHTSYELSSARRPAVVRGRQGILGASVARGDILLFTDSDCAARPDWLCTMVGAVRESGAPIGAPVSTPPDAALFAQCFNFITHTWLGGQGSRWRLLGFLPGYRLRTMNLAVSRRLFEEALGFQPISYGEDTELSERLGVWDTSLYLIAALALYIARLGIRLITCSNRLLRVKPSCGC